MNGQQLYEMYSKKLWEILDCRCDYWDDISHDQLVWNAMAEELNKGNMKKFYATFGADSKYRNNFVVIEALNESDARKTMFGIYDRAWAFLYTEEAFAGQPEKYNLTEIPLE